MSPKTPPGETREKIYEFMRDRLLDGNPPTVREVQARFGFKAVQSAQAHLEQLVAEGRLVKQLSEFKGRARGYTLPRSSVDSAGPTAFAPLLGHIQAGGLEAAIEEREGMVPVQRAGRRAGSEKLFALRVRGESMTGAGILPDDDAAFRKGDRLLRRPTYAAALDARWDVGPAQLHGGLRWSGSRADADFSTYPATRVSLAAYTLVDAGVTLRPFPRAASLHATAVEVQVRNLFDASYQMAYGFPAQGRMVLMGIRVGMEH